VRPPVQIVLIIVNTGGSTVIRRKELTKENGRGRNGLAERGKHKDVGRRGKRGVQDLCRPAEKSRHDQEDVEGMLTKEKKKTLGNIFRREYVGS